MAGTVSAYQIGTYTTPVEGGSLDASVVVSNDNTTGTKHNSHDADATIHVQSSSLASRPSAGTPQRLWVTTDGKRAYFDFGGAWTELQYLPLAGGTMTGSVAGLSTSNAVIHNLSAISTAPMITISGSSSTPNSAYTSGRGAGSSVVVGTDAGVSRLMVFSAGAGAPASRVVLTSTRGTVASPTATQNGDTIGVIEFGGYTNQLGNGAEGGASIVATTTQTWAAGAAGAKLAFGVTANGSTTQTTALTLGQDASATFAGAVSGITTLATSGKITSGGQLYVQGAIATGAANTLALANAGSGASQIWALGADATTVGTLALVVAESDLGNSITALSVAATGVVSLAAGLDLTGNPPTAAASHVAIGGATQTTIGANGAASALTANPLGYLKINVAGTAAIIPYYNA